jgi:[ribosomal protein S5]-alanine N-acetyltransferase
MIETPRLTLLLPGPEAAARVADYYRRNRDPFAPWVTIAPHLETEDCWRERLARRIEEHAQDRSLCLFAFRRGETGGPVLASINFTNIARGVFQACNVGYTLDRDEVGKGVMQEALGAACAHVFEKMRLHRIMANYMPANERSGRLLRRLGFVVEGLARDYLFINGKWCDHVLTALTNPRPEKPEIGCG